MSDFESEDQVDVWIDQNLTLPKNGVLVDVGAAHPRRYSQSHWLRARGWSWLAIDGNPQYASEWQSQEGGKFIQAVVLDGQPIRFLSEPTNSLVSRVHSEGELVQSRRLSDILTDEGITKIDFLSIDIENSEPSVLSDIFEWGFFPMIIVAEYNSEHFGINTDTINIPIKSGYKLVHMTIGNAVFIRE